MDDAKKDLGDALAQHSNGLRFIGIMGTRSRYLSLKLYVRLVTPSTGAIELFEIICANAVDYVIRPRNPNCIEGGPRIELHDHHPWLEDPRLQSVPGGDGEDFDPPLKLKLLVLEQCHVFAEKFQIQPWNRSDFD